MLDREKVSIVLPCYNHGEFVEDAINSVLNQTYKNFELFVYDNGSTDDSWSKICKFDDNRIIKKRFEHNSMQQVKTDFISSSNGYYVAIMYSDDYWAETKLEKQVNLLNSHKEARICFTGFEAVDGDLNSFGNDSKTIVKNRSVKAWWEQLLKRSNCIPCPALFCEHEIYVKYMSTVYPYRQIADLYGWMKILQETNIFFVEEVLIKLRQHHYGNNKNESAATDSNIARESIEFPMMLYKLVSEMDDSYFMEYLTDFDGECSHIEAMCHKFLFFKSRSAVSLDEHRNAIRYYMEHFNDECDEGKFGEYLERKYNFSRNHFFDFEVEQLTSTSVEVVQSRIFKKMENTDFEKLAYPEYVYIYGCGHIGKALYRRISKYCSVKGFVESEPKKEVWEGVRIYRSSEIELDGYMNVVVTPIQDFGKIRSNIVIAKPGFEDKIVSVMDFLSNASN